MHFTYSVGSLCCLTVLGMVALTPPLHSQSPPGEVWTCDALVERVVQSHPDIRKERMAQEWAVADGRAGLALGDWQATGFYMPGAHGQPFIYGEGQIDIPVSLPLRNRARKGVEEGLDRLADASVAGAEQQARLAVEYTVLEWVEADARMRLWAQHVTWTGRLLDWFATREAEGEATAMERQAAELGAHRADHEFHVALLDRQDAEAQLGYWIGDAEFTIDSIVPPPLDLGHFSRDGLLMQRFESDAGLGRLRSDSSLRAAQLEWSERLSQPQVQVGYNVQGIAGDVYQGPVMGLSWALPSAGKRQAASRAAMAMTNHDLMIRSSALEQEMARLWRHYEARSEHHATWQEHRANQQDALARAFDLYTRQLLDLPTFLALWQNDLEGALELIACEADIRRLRAQLLIGSTPPNTPKP